MIEMEIWGGGTARYLARYRRRRFLSIEAAREYAAQITSCLDEMGVRAAHPVRFFHGGRDITREVEGTGA